MKLIKKTIFGLVLLFPTIVSSMCGVTPTHNFDMNIYACREITIGAGLVPYKFENNEHLASDELKGYLVQGFILNDVLEWGKSDFKESKYFKPWETGVEKTIYIGESNLKICTGSFPKKASFYQVEKGCCDVLISSASCLLKYPEAKIK